MPGLAIVAGRGVLPRMLAEKAAASMQNYVVVRFRGAELEWLNDHALIEAEFEKFGALFAALTAAGCDAVVFAGGMDRPHFDTANLDKKTEMVLRQLAPHLGKGDDQTLRAVARIFEAEGFSVIAAQDLLDDLLADPGPMGAHNPTAADIADLARAREIALAVGAIDVGQGAVVAQGLCLGVESLQGTDALLEFVTRTAKDLRPDPNGGRGVLYKGPKPGQDLRMDLPAIGPETIMGAADAGLAGIGVAAGQVMILDRGETVKTADRLGLFLFGLSD